MVPRYFRLLPLILLAALTAAAPARANDFFKGKMLTIVVGFSPGGGYDVYARTVARYIGSHIPGNPTVIVQNMPGAGSLTAVRYLNLTAPRDGTVIATFNPGLVTQSIIEPDKVDLDFQKNYAWVGVMTPDFRVCYGFGPQGVKTWDDMMQRKQFIIGSTGKGAGNYINGATLREVFHAPLKQILGFPGSADQRLAIERGELDGDCGSYSSIPLNWIKDGSAHPFVRFNQTRPDEIPENAAYIGGFATSDEQRQLLRVLNGGDDLGRSLIMSRAVPATQMAILRKAFDDTMTDPAFIADMTKQEMPVHPVSGQGAEAIINDMRNASPDITAKAKAIYD